MVRVDDERKVQVELRLECLVRCHIVRTYAKDNRILLVEGRFCVAEPARLNRSARCVVLRIEVQDDALPSQVTEPDRLILVSSGFEIGRLVPDLELCQGVTSSLCG